MSASNSDRIQEAVAKTDFATDLVVDPDETVSPSDAVLRIPSDEWRERSRRSVQRNAELLRRLS